MPHGIAGNDRITRTSREVNRSLSWIPSIYKLIYDKGDTANHKVYKAGWRRYLSNMLWTEKACHLPRCFYICIPFGIMTILQTVWIEHGQIHLKVEAKILGTLLSLPREQTRKLRSQASESLLTHDNLNGDCASMTNELPLA